MSDVIERCERLLVGLGGDTWDPVCWLRRGHDGACMPIERVVLRLEAQLEATGFRELAEAAQRADAVAALVAIQVIADRVITAVAGDSP